MVSMGDWAERRLKNLSKTDQIRDVSKVGERFWKAGCKLDWPRKKCTRPMFFTWQPRLKTKITALFFLTICQNGSSNYLPGRAIGFWTRLRGQVQLTARPKKWAVIQLVLKFCRNMFRLLALVCKKFSLPCLCWRSRRENIMALTNEAMLAYVSQHIGEFHARRLESLQRLKLEEILRRKNPYLFPCASIEPVIQKSDAFQTNDCSLITDNCSLLTDN